MEAKTRTDATYGGGCCSITGGAIAGVGTTATAFVFNNFECNRFDFLLARVAGAGGRAFRFFVAVA